MTVKVLESKSAIMDNISPTGTKYVLQQVEYNNALYKITTTGKSGSVPAKLAGLYTSLKNAQSDLTQYLIERWYESDTIANGLKSNRIAKSS